MEYRFCELRREGRTLEGKAIAYGDTARIGARAERFLPGAFGADVGGLDVLLNVQHDRARRLTDPSDYGRYELRRNVNRRGTGRPSAFGCRGSRARHVQRRATDRTKRGAPCLDGCLPLVCATGVTRRNHGLQHHEMSGLRQAAR